MRYLALAAMLFVTPFTQAQAVSLNQEEMNNLGITLAVPEPAEQSVSSHYPAKVAIPNTAQQIVHTSQDGVIVNMFVAEGDVVKKGQLLATLNSPQLLMLQSEYLQAYSLLQQYNNDMQRDKQLFDEGIIAERRYLQSKTQYQQQKTNVDGYAKTLQLSGMSTADISKLASGRSMNSTLNIYSPADAVVMQQHAIPGQRVSAADTIYQLADLSTLWLEIHVPLAVARQTEKDATVMTCDRDIKATVITVGRQVHDIDQGVLVRAVVDEKTDQLTPGEFTQVCFVMDSHASLYIVPRNALFRYQGSPSIFVLKGQDLQLIPVEVVSEQNETLMISAELAAESQIVTSGIAALKAVWMERGAE